MPVSTTTDLDSLIVKATSESIPNGELDLPPALEISDVVRSRKISPKECMRCLKRRVLATSSNPNTQLSSWKLIDICIKNGGIPFIKEICSREFMDTMESTIIKSDKDPELRELVQGMFYELYLAFHNDSQLKYVAKVHEKLVSHGIQFPDNASEGARAIAMFDSRTPADWVDSDACMICSKKFSLLTRRHHCRSCGGIFCQDHSSNYIVLPDLGIHESVRVCDNCFEDYDLKKNNGERKKHRSKKSRKKKSLNDSDDYEDEELGDDLRKAIELSLKESKGNVEPIIPVMQKKDVKPPPRTLEEEEDPDLKAAIEASLKEAAEEKKRLESLGQLQNTNSKVTTQLHPSVLSYNPTAAEEEDIHLFASLVERMKGQSPSEILEDVQLQTLYQKVIGIRPKLNNALNDTIKKYNLLMDMNTKISDIMNIYDELLERQLQNINLSERYSLPQVPSDPYSYYQRPAPVELSHTQLESPPSKTQGYQRAAMPLQSHNLPEQYQFLQPQQRDIQSQLHNEQHDSQNKSLREGQSQHELPYPTYIGDRGQDQTQPTAQQQKQPYSDRMQNIDVHIDPHRVSATDTPSEPPYPTTEEEDTSTRKQSLKSTDGALMAERPPAPAGRKLSNGRPYPLEDEEGSVPSHLNNTITNFDFPTVPTKKVEPELQEGMSDIRTEGMAVSPQPEEPLLIEL